MTRRLCAWTAVEPLARATAHGCTRRFKTYEPFRLSMNDKDEDSCLRGKSQAPGAQLHEPALDCVCRMRLVPRLDEADNEGLMLQRRCRSSGSRRRGMMTATSRRHRSSSTALLDDALDTGQSTSLPTRLWKGGRAVECTGLENRQAGNPRLGSSNLPPSVESLASHAGHRVWSREVVHPRHAACRYRCGFGVSVVSC